MQSIKNIMKLITENIPVYIILNDFNKIIYNSLYDNNLFTSKFVA